MSNNKEILEKLRGTGSKIIIPAAIAGAVTLGIKEENKNIDAPADHSISVLQNTNIDNDRAKALKDSKTIDFVDVAREMGYQVDTVSNANHGGAYYSSRKIITQVYDDKKDEVFNHDKYNLTKIHEKKHEDDYANGFMSLPLNKEQMFKAQQHLEVAANLAEFLALRNEYLKNPQEFDNSEHRLVGVFDEYIKAIESGEITPNSENQENFDQEMGWVFKNVKQAWSDNYESSYMDSHIKNSEDFATFSTENDANYQQTLNIVYGKNLGGVNFMKYFDQEEDFESPDKFNGLEKHSQVFAKYLQEKNPFEQDMSLEQWSGLNVFAEAMQPIEKELDKYYSPEERANLSEEEKSEMFNKFLEFTIMLKDSDAHKYVYENEVGKLDYQPQSNDENFAKKLLEMTSNIKGVDFSKQAAEFAKSDKMNDINSSSQALAQMYPTDHLPEEKPSFVDKLKSGEIKEDIKKTFDEYKDKLKQTLGIDDEINHHSFQSGSHIYTETPQVYFEHGEKNGDKTMRVSKPMEVEIFDLSSNSVIGLAPNNSQNTQTNNKDIEQSNKSPASEVDAINNLRKGGKSTSNNQTKPNPKPAKSSAQSVSSNLSIERD